MRWSRHILSYAFFYRMMRLRHEQHHEQSHAWFSHADNRKESCRRGLLLIISSADARSKGRRRRLTISRKL